MARILFLQSIEYEFLGPMYLSSMVKKYGHDCRLAVGETIDKFTPAIEQFKPDIIGFSIMSGSHLWAINMARQIKVRYDTLNIFGGPHATFFPEMIEEEGIDLIVRGEGEETLLDVMNCIDTKSPMDAIPNLCIKKKDGTIIRNPLRNLNENLDDYPFPDRQLYDCLKGKIDQSVRCVITSRGCPYHCNFCFQDSLRQLYKGKGKYIRIRKSEKIIEECKSITEHLSTRAIYFRDDVFGVDKKWFYDFLKTYKKEIGLEFMCLVRADVVAADEKYASSLAEAGCRMVFWGIESGDERMRNLVLNKQLTDEKIIKAAEYLHKAKIKFLTFNIIGLPGETLDEALSTAKLNIAIKTNYPWCSLYFPLPGTRLTDYAAANGYFDPDYHKEIYNKTFYSGSAIRSPDIQTLENLQRFFQTAVLWPWTFPMIKRLIRMKPNQIFKWWFGLIYFYVHVKSENRNFWLTLKFALRNFKTQLSKDGKT
jgi:anaerobic magnesium-protoporphyrin IX monomethyl ester cyclase